MTKEEIEKALDGKHLNHAVFLNDGSYRFYHSGHPSFGDTHFGSTDDWVSFEYRQIKKIVPIGEVIALDYHGNVGSDPELFFTDKDGEVVPSVQILGESKIGLVHQDGFQFELNPSPNTCRQSAATGIGLALRAARDIATGKNLNIDFSVGKTIGLKAWKSAGRDVRRFGCNPTKNIYEPKFKRPTGILIKHRSGAGHIHLQLGATAKRKTENLVKLLDIFVGNTCVLIDRDPSNITRRKYYGQAGEYREKSYGIEYRVPSNFWMRGYILWSMVAGLSRNAIGIVEVNKDEELLARFDMNKVKKAINENDYDLALENFEVLKDWINEKNIISGFGFNCMNVDKFIEFINSPIVKDVMKVRDLDTIINDFISHDSGFEYTINNKV
jgi:hypothetical protein